MYLVFLNPPSCGIIDKAVWIDFVHIEIICKIYIISCLVAIITYLFFIQLLCILILISVICGIYKCLGYRWVLESVTRPVSFELNDRRSGRIFVYHIKYVLWFSLLRYILLKRTIISANNFLTRHYNMRHATRWCWSLHCLFVDSSIDGTVESFRPFSKC